MNKKSIKERAKITNLDDVTEELIQSTQSLLKGIESNMWMQLHEYSADYNPEFYEKHKQLPDNWTSDRAITNLIMLYHNTDWEKYDLIYMGY